MTRLLVASLLIARTNALSAVATRPTTMDAASLRNADLARAAAAQQSNDRGLLWLEHVNIVVGRRDLAERFYFEEGLGCFTDPAKPRTPGAKGTMWANLGSQQFHLAEEADDDPPQAVRGSIGLALPDVDAACARLERLAAEVPSVNVERHSDARFTATCPWGNVFHCYAARRGEKDAEKPKMVGLHAGDGYAGGDAFGVRGGPGIRYVEFLVDDAAAAARAYAREFGAAAEASGDRAAVSCGLGPTHLLFETAPADAVASQKQDGVHLCVYVDAFSERYDRLRETARVFTNPRFKHLDTCDTLDEALASRTFRFAFPEIPNLEHETRALSHVQFLKNVAYEPV